MDLSFLMDINKMPKWRLLQKMILSEQFIGYKNVGKKLSSYDLVHVLVDGDGEPRKLSLGPNDVESYAIFTQSDLAARLEHKYTSKNLLENVILSHNDDELKTMMLGQLVYLLKDRTKMTPIKVNPLRMNVDEQNHEFLYCEEVLFAPQYDSVTNKYLLTDPEDARALLAISPNDEERYGIEIVYYMMTSRELPEDKEDRDNFLKEKIEELAFIAPRVPIKKGSASLFAVLLNFENEIEERAFIRDYPLLDNYSDLIFVTSGLKILTGSLEEIYYRGEKIDTIFTPLINWQKQKHCK